jgi:hypothetical protein
MSMLMNWWPLLITSLGMKQHIKCSEVILVIFFDTIIVWERFYTCITVVSRASAHSRVSTHAPQFKGSI